MKPILFSTPMVQAILAGRKTMTRRVIKPQPNGEIKASIPYEYYGTKTERIFTDTKAYLAPYSVGDILWVRETWNSMKLGIFGTSYWYKADEPRDADTGVLRERWRPSIHMPREAARIFLRVTNVRIERLWDITETDVRKEGFSDHFDIETDTFYPCGYFFKHTWNSLYAKRGYGWDANPWVWVIEFERCEKPEVNNEH